MSSSSQSIFQPDTDRCIFTICTKSYIGLANALGASLHARGVAADYVIVIVDHNITDVSSPFGRLVPATEICGYDTARWAERAFKYDLVELCTSIKARCFQALFEAGYDKVIYFDPDIIVFDDLHTVFTGLEDHDVVVTPHRLAYDSDMPARGGVFNIGFLAARRSLASDRVLAWWDARLENRSLSDPIRGFFTDQKWLDHLPVLLRDGRLMVSGHPGMNLAPWNFGERTLDRRGEGWVVSLRGHEAEPKPLSFVHFSAFNYRMLAQGLVDPSTAEAVAQVPKFAEISEVLASYLRQGRFLDYSSIPYEFSTFSDGRPILQGHRRIFQRLQERGESLPEPFSTQGLFYLILQRSGLLARKSAGGTEKIRGKELERKIDRAASLLDSVSRLALRMVGYPRFSQLSKLLVRYFHTNNHARLLQYRGEKIDVEYF
ncbi:hypothetical protein [Mesorhizobium australicum]|uniref:Nucleotide-diphospho-sugar transferase n=1 Tax=Mesorhizobium australicum TaxID=536018 RepID=A0A1X7NRG4_9HYPH|nr:hypothetical protein [Mesorhizobium australicum]SMH40665.1 hypothetical protein SAMN02982922_2394 [Mesorhizobium australicum]